MKNIQLYGINSHRTRARAYSTNHPLNSYPSKTALKILTYYSRTLRCYLPNFYAYKKAIYALVEKHTVCDTGRRAISDSGEVSSTSWSRGRRRDGQHPRRRISFKYLIFSPCCTMYYCEGSNSDYSLTQIHTYTYKQAHTHTLVHVTVS